ncbi:unnamed protein product [Vitrella brassicaformis CCMP3155]|uniref:Iron-binding zinc finger CDGSH type domain-containing protein n=1 Tax=Vitrella brassicaformis (strain CCMP3155) TaxID=1169540 RepID=A0A0G4EIP8_VITBC|nr:unnamed protein product [Vitrella brassicaformis CCMP3155]|mmetsp:Transcript_21271/g.51972  ORF Transcript_21271/g.51972 Transcript_21271/m.51972 type:complete len:246 (-) Transcript_21271:1271-2008(-)|eukprot:CEL96884.1 unnamed protein product [Vitrella brassicaformis CCMP3155]
MGGMLTSHYHDLPRHEGDNWNMRPHDKKYDIEHYEVWTPDQHMLNSRKFLVCRCYKSDKFPLCDQSHGALCMQGAKIGPCLLEVRKDLGGVTTYFQNQMEKKAPTKLPDNYYPMDPLQNFEKVDPNVLDYNDYHHVIETYPPPGGPDKKIRICRCWQSKRFPICDDTHKALVEAGDSVGPYTAILRGNANGGKQLAKIAEKAGQASKATAAAAAMVATGIIAAGLVAGAAQQMFNSANLNRNDDE